MKVIVRAVAAVAVLAASAGVAAAQNYNLNANYGAVRLNSGFTPDPYNINLSSGGSINAANAIGGSCRGYISNAPDFELTYSAGSSLPLIISVNSSADTTLVVNGPDGRWYCDDDGGDGLNPSLRFGRPMSGTYDIWVGTYGSSSLQSATLSISELYSY